MTSSEQNTTQPILPTSPSQARKRQVDLLNGLYADALKAKEQIIGTRWKDVDTYFCGKQSRFGEKAVSPQESWKADTRTNHIYAFYLSMVSVLMRDIPSIDPSARHDSILPQEKILKELIRSIMLRNEFPEREEELLYTGSLYGRGAIKTTWDKRMNSGVGDVRLDVVSAKNLVLQPGKYRVRDCSYLFEITMMDKLSLLLLYPDQRDEIMRLFTPKDTQTPTETYTVDMGMEGTHTDGTGMSVYYDLMGGKSPRECVPVVEAWLQDPETVERFGWIKDPKEGSYVKRKRHYRQYPTGRYIRFSGPVIFEDRPNPFPSFPYSEYVNMSMETEWPLGEMDQLVSIQKIYDTARNQLTDAMNFSVTGDRLFVDARSGLEPSELTNRPGEIVNVASVEGIKSISGPRIPGEAFANLERIQADFDRVSGYPEILSGGMLGDVRSGYAIEQINELVRGRLKLKTYTLEATFRDMARKITDMIGLYYIRGLHYPGDVDLVGMRSDWFEYRVKAGLNLPASQRSQEQYLMQLLDRIAPMQDPSLYGDFFTYIVEQTDLPGKDALVERLREKVAMLPAGPPPAEGGGAPAPLQVVGQNVSA